MAIVHKNLRQNNKMTEAEWLKLEEVGYVRLGIVLPEAEIDRLCQRIDEITAWHNSLRRDEDAALSFLIQSGADNQLFCRTQGKFIEVSKNSGTGDGSIVFEIHSTSII